MLAAKISSAVCQPNASISATRERRDTGTGRTSRPRCRRRSDSERQFPAPACRTRASTRCERAAGQAEADQHAGREIERQRVGGIGHEGEAEPHTCRAPAHSTRTVPKRSAIAPANGWPTPHSRFWIASANENTSRPQPFAERQRREELAERRARPEGEHARSGSRTARSRRACARLRRRGRRRWSSGMARRSSESPRDARQHRALGRTAQPDRLWLHPMHAWHAARMAGGLPRGGWKTRGAKCYM